MNKGATYLVLGHSTSWIGTTGIANTYSCQIKERIFANYGVKIHLVNKGIGGATSSDLVKNIHWDLGLHPDFVTIDIGGNDCLNGQISVADYTANIQKIIDTIKAINPACLIMLCTMVYFDDANRTPYAPLYRTALEGLATANSLPVVNFENAYSQQNVRNYAPDGLHPADAGHELMAEILWTGMTGNASISRWLNKLKDNNYL